MPAPIIYQFTQAELDARDERLVQRFAELTAAILKQVDKTKWVSIKQACILLGKNGKPISSTTLLKLRKTVLSERVIAGSIMINKASIDNLL